MPKREQIVKVKSPVKAAPAPLDTRTPGGRKLPW